MYVNVSSFYFDQLLVKKDDNVVCLIYLHTPLSNNTVKCLVKISHL